MSVKDAPEPLPAPAPARAPANGELVLRTLPLARTWWWAPDSRHVVLGDTDGKTSGVTIVDVATGRAMRVDRRLLHGDVAFSPDGRFVALTIGDRTTSIIELATGEDVTPDGAADSTLFRTYFTDDSRIVWADADAHGLYVHVEPGGVLTAPRTSDCGLVGAAFRHGDVIAWTDDHVYLWRGGLLVASSPRASEFDDDPVLDGSRVVFRVADPKAPQRIAWIDLASPYPQVALMPLRSAACTQNTQNVVMACGRGRFVINEDGHACLWDLAQQRLVSSIATGGQTYGVCVDGKISLTQDEPPTAEELDRERYGDDGSTGATIDRDGRGLIVRHRRGAEVVLEASTTCDRATFSPDDTLIAGASADGAERIWDTATGRIRWQTPAGHDATFVAFDRGQLITATNDGALRKPGERAIRLAGCELYGLAAGTSVCADGQRLRLVHGATSVQVGSWDYGLAGGSFAYLAGGELHVVPEAAPPWTVPVRVVWGVGVSARGDLVAYEDKDGVIVVRDRRGERWRSKAVRSSVTIEIADDGHVAAGDAYMIYAWDDRGGEIYEAPVSSMKYPVLALDRGGRWLAVASDHDGVAIVDLATRASHVLPGSDRLIAVSTMASSGERLAVASAEGIAIWDHEAGPTMMYVSNTGAAIVDGSGARVLGDGSGLVACRLGPWLAPYAACR